MNNPLKTKIALIGYGRMGKSIHQIITEMGDEVVAIFDENNPLSQQALLQSGAQVAIEFTQPDAAFNNIVTSLNAKVPVVVGTTGWLNHYNEVAQIAKQNNTAFLYASNFSIGVNIMFHINKVLANLINQFPDYKAELTEVHHIHKKDSPSGTAITIAEGIINQINRIDSWIEVTDKSQAGANQLPITAIREGEVFGIHEVSYHSPIDQISIRHQANSRDGFARGAVSAAKWIVGKQGVFTMQDVLGL